MGAAIPPLSDSPPRRLPDLPPVELPLSFTLAEPSASMEVQEVVHDPELDEAVIAFANADYDSSERALTELVRPGGSRNLHGETWLVLFDHYRATAFIRHHPFAPLDRDGLFGVIVNGDEIDKGERFVLRCFQVRHVRHSIHSGSQAG